MSAIRLSVSEETVDGIEWVTEGDLEVAKIEPLWRHDAWSGWIAESLVVVTNKLCKKIIIQILMLNIRKTNPQGMESWLFIKNFITNFFILTTQDMLKATLQVPGVIFRVKKV